MILSQTPIEEQINFLLSVRHNIDISPNIHIIIGIFGEIHVIYYCKKSHIIILNEGIINK
jgi:hypothetical protein